MAYSPENPESYNKDQIILNSGRLLLNAKEDAILLFAKKAISFSSTDSVHINCDTKPGFIVNAPEIHLGLKSRNKPEEPLIKGTTLKEALYVLLDDLEGLVDQISGGVHGKEGTPYSFVGAALIIKQDIEDIKQNISKSLSTQNYTI
jgi:hypothetical protein